MQPTRSYGSNSDFYVFGDRDIWPILVIFLDNADTILGYLHIKLCNNKPAFNEVMVWYRAADISTEADSQTHKTPTLQ